MTQSLAKMRKVISKKEPKTKFTTVSSLGDRA